MSVRGCSDGPQNSFHRHRSAALRIPRGFNAPAGWLWEREWVQFARQVDVRGLVAYTIAKARGVSGAAAAALMPGKIKRAIALSIATGAIALAGCWPFHSNQETQQQKFIEALNHGNGAQASQIWLHMDANSRAEFAHSQGMHPNLSSDEVQKQVMQHYQDKMGGDDSGESIERPTPYLDLGGLQSLPGYVGRSGAPAQSVTAPAPNAPSN